MQHIFFIIPFAAILGGLAYVLLLYNLENDIGRRILFFAFARITCTTKTDEKPMRTTNIKAATKISTNVNDFFMVTPNLLIFQLNQHDVLCHNLVLLQL